MSVLFTCVAKTDYHKIFSNMYIRVIVEVVLLFWPLLVMISAPSLQVVVTILVSLVSYTVKAFAETRKETWEFHFNMAFWGQFFFTFPMILMSANVVTQQRDGLLNMLVYCIGVCVSLNALSGDYCMAVASRANKPALDGSYKTILFFSWLNNALLILTIFNISSSTFPSNPFSNTASGMWAVTSIVCIIPILQPRSVWRSEDRWSRLIANRYSLDLVARIIYTIAVMIDLSATGYVDNVVIGSPLEH